MGTGQPEERAVQTGCSQLPAQAQTCPALWFLHLQWWVWQQARLSHTLLASSRPQCHVQAETGPRPDTSRAQTPQQNSRSCLGWQCVLHTPLQPTADVAQLANGGWPDTARDTCTQTVHSHMPLRKQPQSSACANPYKRAHTLPTWWQLHVSLSDCPSGHQASFPSEGSSQIVWPFFLLLPSWSPFLSQGQPCPGGSPASPS